MKLNLEMFEFFLLNGLTLLAPTTGIDGHTPTIVVSGSKNGYFMNISSGEIGTGRTDYKSAILYKDVVELYALITTGILGTHDETEWSCVTNPRSYMLGYWVGYAGEPTDATAPIEYRAGHRDGRNKRMGIDGD